MPFGFKKSVHIWLLSALLVSAAVGCTATHPDIIPQKGFRNISWGTPMGNLVDITPLRKDGGRWARGIRDPERLRIGDVAVDAITYIFADSAFAGIDVLFSGDAAFHRLALDLEKNMGPPTVVNRKMNALTWKNAGTTIMLRYYRMQSRGTLKYLYNPLFDG